MTTTVRLRPLAENDFERLHDWHNSPHLRPFYMKGDIDRIELERKFVPRLLASHSVRCRIAEFDAMPFGFLQWYLSKHWEGCGAYQAGLIKGVSADYFIGDSRFLRKGLAPKMLERLVEEVFAEVDLDERLVCLAHDEQNRNAIIAASSAGFKAEANVIDGSTKTIVFVKRADSV